jgi:hypothetical protein
MSLITLPEAHSFSTGIEVEGFVKCMESGKEIWIDYLQEVRRVCNAKLTDGKGNMINIAFWGDDIRKVRNNLKIRITDAKWNDTKKVLYKTRIGKISVYGFNPNSIFDDMEKFKRYHTNLHSIKQYYDIIKNSKSKNHLGLNKFEYLKIIDDFVLLEFAKKRLTRCNNAVSSALFHLHKIITMTPVQIRQTLGLFGINIEIDSILRISSEWDVKRFMFDSSKTTHKITPKSNDMVSLEISHPEYSFEGIPDGMIVEDELRDDDSGEPICFGNSLEFHRKYKGYANF